MHRVFVGFRDHCQYGTHRRRWDESVLARSPSASVIAKVSHFDHPLFPFFFVNWKYKITNFSKVIIDIRLRPRFCSLANNFECMRYWRCLCLADYGQTWRHPQNWKCITYCIVVRQGPSHGHNNTNLTSTENFVKFGRVVFKICEQRHRQTGSLQYFAPLLGRSNIISQCCFYCSHIHFMRNNNNTERKLWAYRLTYDSLNDDRLKYYHITVVSALNSTLPKFACAAYFGINLYYGRSTVCFMHIQNTADSLTVSKPSYRIIIMFKTKTQCTKWASFWIVIPCCLSSFALRFIPIGGSSLISGLDQLVIC